MPHVLYWGKRPEPKPPWYESTTIICAHCDTAFMLMPEDFRDRTWVERKSTVPGVHTVEGICPCCDAPMLVDVDDLLRKTTRGYTPVSQRPVTVLDIANGFPEGHLEPGQYDPAVATEKTVDPPDVPAGT